MLRDLLRGFQARSPQTVGNMTLVPLLKQSESAVGDLGDLYLEQDTSYDTLMMATRSPHVTIVPQGLVYITKEKAQDRTIPSAHLVKRQKTCHAFCVQSSQAGLMQRDKTEQRQLHLLPAGLRLAALHKRQQEGFNAIWDDLAAFNQKLNVPGNFLVSFFAQYQKQLAEFVAEFEPVPLQRGAAIAISGEVVGVEIMPNNSAFLALWEPLIRDCYGAEALLHSVNVPTPIVMQDVLSLDNLVQAVDDLARREQQWAASKVEAVLVQKERLQEEQREGSFGLYTVETDEYAGQLVQRYGETLYMSLLRKPPQRRSFRWLNWGAKN